MGRPGKYDRLELTTGPTKAVEAGHHVERLTREELGRLGPIVATALAWYKEHEEELENVELEGWPEPMVSFIEALSPIEASKLFAAAERDLSREEQEKPSERDSNQ